MNLDLGLWDTGCFLSLLHFHASHLCCDALLVHVQKVPRASTLCPLLFPSGDQWCDALVLSVYSEVLCLSARLSRVSYLRYPLCLPVCLHVLPVWATCDVLSDSLSFLCGLSVKSALSFLRGLHVMSTLTVFPVWLPVKSTMTVCLSCVATCEVHNDSLSFLCGYL